MFRVQFYLSFILSGLIASTAQAFFVNGTGNYNIKAGIITNPGFQPNTGTYQAIEHSLSLTGEVKANDKLSFFLNLKLNSDDKPIYLGDKASPNTCQKREGTNSKNEVVDSDSQCLDRTQNPDKPSYQRYTPQIDKAYVRYAFEYCLLEAGRRPRDWGLGMYLDSGDDPFELSSSVFDGLDCRLNIQKTDLLGFRFGYDKLQETGAFLYDIYTDPASANDNKAEFDARKREFGAKDKSDDLNQLFFTLEYNDTIANSGAPFTKNIGVYFAQIDSSDVKNGGSGTDMKFLDLFTGFYLPGLSIENEFLFRMGHSADPAFIQLGGSRLDSDGEIVRNKVQSLAATGKINWNISKTGTYSGPKEFNKGNIISHSVGFEYAYAPGDKKGYFGKLENGVNPTSAELDLEDTTYGEDMRNSVEGANTAKAYAFNPNFKPALIFFNNNTIVDEMAKDGIYSPNKLLNVSMYALSYEFIKLGFGSLSTKLITGYLNEDLPEEIKSFYESKAAVLDDKDASNNEVSADSGKRPVGFFGLDLGYEIDIEYYYSFGRDVKLGMSVAYAIPGKAFQIDKNRNPENTALFQTFVNFYF